MATYDERVEAAKRAGRRNGKRRGGQDSNGSMAARDSGLDAKGKRRKEGQGQGKVIRVLLVEDSADDALLLERELAPMPALRRARTGAARNHPGYRFLR